jgi:hypothetical protein
MLYNAQGEPIKSNPSVGKIDAFQLPDGAFVSKKISMEFHNRLRNDAALRERIEQADRQTGTESWHLALLRHDTGRPNDEAHAIMERNLEFGEKIQQRRVKEEAKDLPHTKASLGG